ncbi:MAG: alkaline phosphatase family protein, partial [Acidobacteriota bacterium]|nr:alkaline phosphatase family protein [Acidobacteriota bacterium]
MREESGRQKAWVNGLVLAGLLACSGGADHNGASSTPPPVLVLAADGLEWSLVLPMAQAGELPELARLMDTGTFGFLRTSRPTFSPIIWTSIATGRPPVEHGVRGFVRQRGRDRRLFNSYDRKTKAFWNILSDYGRRVATVGWWMTFPVEEVDGVMVAQVNTIDQTRRTGGRAILKGGLVEELEGQVFPTDRLDEFLEINRRVSGELAERMIETFGFSRPQTPLARRLWENTSWSLRADATYLEIAERLAGERFDLLACYLGGTDVVA